MKLNDILTDDDILAEGLFGLSDEQKEILNGLVKHVTNLGKKFVVARKNNNYEMADEIESEFRSLAKQYPRLKGKLSGLFKSGMEHAV